MTPSYLLFDFETRSLCKLRDLGGRIYAQHPTTEVLCVTYAVAEGSGWALGSQWAPREYPFAEQVDVAVAHIGLDFDRHIWEITLGWPPPKRWLDTAIMARRAGFAASALDKVGSYYGFPKDVEGSKLTKSLSRPSRKRPGTFHVDPIPAATRRRVIEYCEADVLVMCEVFDNLAAEYDFGAFPAGTWQAFEERVLQVDVAMQDRGVAFDAEFAKALIYQEVQAAARACAAAGVEPEQVRSVPQFKELLAERGIDVPNAQRETLEAYADEPLVAARLACTSIARGKLEKGLALATDGRLRDTTKHLGAHTWRWSGRGMQIQNLPRGVEIGSEVLDEGTLVSGSGKLTADIYDRILGAACSST